jgi:hypothetical protein
MDNLLTQLKLLTKESNEELLSLYLEQAEQMILLETNRTHVPLSLRFTQLQLAQYLIERHGNAGEVSRSEGGISITYSDDLPVNIMKPIKAARLVRCGGRVFEKPKTL